MGHPVDDRYEEITNSFLARLETVRANPLTEAEKGQIVFWGLAASQVKGKVIIKVLEEVEQRTQSKKLKDVLWRNIFGCDMPSFDDPRHIRAAKAEVIAEYDALCERLQKAADVQAEIAAEKQRIAAENRARQKRAEELQGMMKNVQKLEKPLQVKRPLSLKNK